MRLRHALVAFALLAAATSAQALESKVSKTSSQSVDAVWQKIGPDFCGIGHWLPPVEKCELSKNGKQRTLSLKGGGTIVEHLIHWSDKTHSYTYRIISSPLPIAHYVSTIRVSRAKGGGSVITWRGHYVAKGASNADAKKAIDGVYEAGVSSLAGD